MREIWLSFKENFALSDHVEEIPLNEGNSVEIPLKESGGR